MSDVTLTSMNRRAFVMSSAAGVLHSAASLAFKPVTADAKEAMSATRRRHGTGLSSAILKRRSYRMGRLPGSCRRALSEDTQGSRRRRACESVRPLAPVVVQENCLVLNICHKLVLFDSGMGS